MADKMKNIPIEKYNRRFYASNALKRDNLITLFESKNSKFEPDWATLSRVYKEMFGHDLGPCTDCSDKTACDDNQFIARHFNDFLESSKVNHTKVKYKPNVARYQKEIKAQLRANPSNCVSQNIPQTNATYPLPANDKVASWVASNSTGVVSTGTPPQSVAPTNPVFMPKPTVAPKTVAAFDPIAASKTFGKTCPHPNPIPAPQPVVTPPSNRLTNPVDLFSMKPIKVAVPRPISTPPVAVPPSVAKIPSLFPLQRAPNREFGSPNVSRGSSGAATQEVVISARSVEQRSSAKIPSQPTPVADSAMAALRSQLAAKDEQIAKLADQVEHHKTLEMDAKKSSMTLRSTLNSAQDTLRHKERHSDDQRKTLIRCKRDLQALKKDNQEAASTAADKLTAAYAEIARLQNNLGESETNRRACFNELNTANRLLNEEKATTRQLGQSYAILKTKLTAVERELAACQASPSPVVDQEKSCVPAYLKLSTEYKHMKSEHERAESEWKSTTAALKTKMNNMCKEMMMTNIKAADERAEVVNQHIEELQQLRDERAQYENNVNVLAESLANAQRSLQSLESKASASTSTNTQTMVMEVAEHATQTRVVETGIYWRNARIVRLLRDGMLVHRQVNVQMTEFTAEIPQMAEMMSLMPWPSGIIGDEFVEDDSDTE